MTAPGNLAPLSIPLRGALQSLGASLRPGQVIRGLIVQTPEGLALRVGAGSVPLPPQSQLTQGQAVTVTVSRSGSTLQLNVEVPRAAAQGAPSQASSLAQAVASVLKTFRSLPPDVAQAAARLVPSELPPTHAAVRALLSLFVTDGNLSGSLSVLSGLVNQAIAAGVLPAYWAEIFARHLYRRDPLRGETIESILQAFREGAHLSLEKRMAQALAKGGLFDTGPLLREDLRAVLGALRGHARFQQFLNEGSHTEAFHTAAEEVSDHLLGGLLQNSRSGGPQYLYLEIPVPPEGFERPVQIHVFQEDSPKKSAAQETPILLVLDVGLSKLGDLWIRLFARANTCECTLSAKSDEIAAFLGDAAGELQSALEESGYQQVTVKVSAAPDHRAERTAGLMARVSGIDMSA